MWRHLLRHHHLLLVLELGLVHAEHLLLLQLNLDLLLHQRLLMLQVLANLLVDLTLGLLLKIFLVHHDGLMLRRVTIVKLLHRLRHRCLFVEFVHLLVNVVLVSRLVEAVVEILDQ